MKIGDLFFDLSVDKNATFQADVVKSAAKAGDAAGQTLGQRLSAGLKNAGKGLIPGLGLGAGIAAFSGLQSAVEGAVGFLKDAAQEAMNDEASVTRLSASLKQNVPAWDGDTKAIEKNILAKQELGFRDEELRDSLSVLVGATHDVAKAQEIQNTAMDLARFKNIDLHSATEALIKVEGGHYRLLASLGINLRAGATATEALAAVQKVAGGQAAVFGETTAGAAAAAGIAWSELQEDIGKLLLPTLKELLVFFRKDLIPALRQVGDGIGEIIDAITSVKDAPGQVADWWRNLFGITPEQNRRFDDEISRAIHHSFGDASAQMDAESARWAGNTVSFIDAAEPVIEAAAVGAYAPISDAMRAESVKAQAEARAIPGAISDALIAGEQDLTDGLDALKKLMTDSLSDNAKIARDKGILSSKELARGLKDERADVRGAAMQLRDDTLKELNLLESGAYDAAVDTGTTLAEQLRMQEDVVSRGMADMLRGARHTLATFNDSAVPGFGSGGTAPARPPGQQPLGGFAEGSWSVPRTGPYILHSAEMVTPAAQAETFRQAMLGGPMGALHGSVTNNYNLTVNGVQQSFRSRDDFIKALDSLARFGGDGRLPTSG